MKIRYFIIFTLLTLSNATYSKEKLFTAEDALYTIELLLGQDLGGKKYEGIEYLNHIRNFHKKIYESTKIGLTEKNLSIYFLYSDFEQNSIHGVFTGYIYDVFKKNPSYFLSQLTNVKNNSRIHGVCKSLGKNYHDLDNPWMDLVNGATPKFEDLYKKELSKLNKNHREKCLKGFYD